MTDSPFATGLQKGPANYVPLSPISFLTRSRDVFGDRTATIFGDERRTWAETHDRAVALASGLKAMGIGREDVVSVLAPNLPELVECHFGVPMAGAVLNTINTRLDPSTIAYILDHSGAKVLLVDGALAGAAEAALAAMEGPAPRVIAIRASEPFGEIDYESLLASAPAGAPALPGDEWDAITLNYTSGTSGRPKGVVYHHRGAYLLALGTIAGWDLPANPKYLYSVPMFHCNGWGHAWTMAAAGGTIVCMRDVSAATVFRLIEEHQVTHFGAAPVVLGMLVNAPDDERRVFTHGVKAMTAGAPPPAAILEKTRELGIDVLQVYGLTETFGHVTECVWKSEWDALPAPEQAAIKARQGVAFPMTEEVAVVDVESRDPVPWDGATQGEVTIRGNTVMKGYFRNPQATEEAFDGGAFRSGDIAVVHPDGYMEIRDRLKDVIISGGENISSVEVEGVVYKHPAVAVAAVVAQPDPRWGESPCAFIELRDGAEATEAEIIAFCRERLAGFQTPKRVVFGELPKTATGKVQKFELRKRARGEG